MMGDYTEFLRIQAKNAVNTRRKKNKSLARTMAKDPDDRSKLAGIGLGRKNKRRKKRKGKKLNDYTLRPLETAGLYTPMSKHLPGRHDQSSHGNRIGAQWGATHRGSSNITAAAARVMGRDGFTFEDSPWGEPGDSGRTRLAARSALRGVRDSRGGEALYSGHSVARGTKSHKVGEEIEIPMAATSGDRDTATSYSSEKERSAGEKDSILYAFEEGTKFKGYQRNEERDPQYNNAVWDEALVSGRFEVIAVDEEEDSYFHYGDQKQRTYKRTVYTLRQTAVFDPDTGQWVSVVGKRWHFDPNQPRDEDGQWTDGGGTSGAAAAMAALLASVQEDEDDELSFPDVDHQEPWRSISYGGRRITSGDVESYGTSSGLTSSVASRDELQAMSDYVAFDRDTLEINRRLRNGEPLDDEQQARNDALDSVANRATLSRDTDIWRGAAISGDQESSLVSGAVIRDPGYASATISRRVAEYYANERDREDGGQILFRIRGKKGDPIIPARNNEWIIPRDTKMVVIGRKGNVVEVEYR